MKKQYRLTLEGIEELKTELNELESQRGIIADRIKTARELGDLGENAEYSSARQEQDRNENRIAEIEHIIQNVEIIKKPRSDNKVQLGSVVKLETHAGKTKEFKVVGTIEADPLSGKISDESPIGRVLIGKKSGDTVQIQTPIETSVYKIIDIS
ncbi:MAG TPA: transcription elongation factor GreA [Patescibacteria group bacterium]|jgi:transcription elongation factor GreA|nr:transcription elongation factor GreA [Patescibacteria group bacterium]